MLVLAAKRRSNQPALDLAAGRPIPIALRRRRALILPRILAHEGERVQISMVDWQSPHAVLQRWADLEAGGHLARKETAVDADFLNEVFGESLGYTLHTQNPQDYHLERQFTVPGVGSADGALGRFGTGRAPQPIAVIELKDADTDLDRDRFNGRTPVQQCWDYLNALPDCPWGIVSNLIELRLYHRDKTPLRFERFQLQELRDARRFREFFALLSREFFVPSRLRTVSRAQELLEQTDESQLEVGDRLYVAYSKNRRELIHHLHRKQGKSVDEAVRIAQKIIDRIIFVAFCEDRTLLPPDTLGRTHREVPPLARVTNPRWRNFLDLFRAVDEGHPKLNLQRGYNGGLFRRDPEVDDLQLDDEWTDFFRTVSDYDFKDEVNVDVLGHLFEKSITELEKLRTGGLFDVLGDDDAAGPRMPKSAERKRFGVYYTPPQFTRFLVDHSLGDVIKQAFGAIAERHGIDPEGTPGDEPPAKLRKYADECLAALRSLRVCDPACGSGAFLIQAYDLLEERYGHLVEIVTRHDERAAQELHEAVPDIILSENLYGVDLSAEAVEITQLALWIRSARFGRTLADLSRNIVCGNSLVSDPGVDPRAIAWNDTFPEVFSREKGGFDCVVGNPPWERIKLQEREFFSLSAPEIAGAVNAATRRKQIADLERKTPELYQRYEAAKQRADEVLTYVRACGDYPLTGKGDVNHYTLFAELASRIVAPTGRVGILVPSGIATDDSTKQFFGELMNNRRLVKLYDFENRERVFPDVDGRFKFTTLVFGGREAAASTPDFVFFAHSFDDVDDPKRHIALTVEDMALVNPNTRTCPVFRSRRDAEITKRVYQRVPILVDESRKERGNPWGIKFVRMFDQTNDAELFHTVEQLKAKKFKLVGNVWVKGKERFLPLYEAKMVQAYDHRAASVVVEADNWMRQGQPVPTSLVQHQNTDYVVQPRWWVGEDHIVRTLGGGALPAFLGFKDITSPTNQRTIIASAIPWSGVTNHFPLMLPSSHPRRTMCLLGNLNSFALDYIARQKIGGVTLNFFIVRQLPILPPDAYEARCPWSPKQTLERWVSDRVLKLTCTAGDMRPFGEACGMKNPVHKWKPAERVELLAELDAAYFRLYGAERDDVEYILSTFTGIREGDVAETGEYRTAKSILQAYDAMG